MASEKTKRDSVRQDILDSLRRIEDPDEFENERYGASQSEKDAIDESPEGKRRRSDWERGAGLGLGAFLAQRFVRRAFRKSADKGWLEDGFGAQTRRFKDGGGGVAKSRTGIGLYTGSASAAIGGGIEEERQANKRRSRRK